MLYHIHLSCFNDRYSRGNSGGQFGRGQRHMDKFDTDLFLRLGLAEEHMRVFSQHKYACLSFGCSRHILLDGYLLRRVIRYMYLHQH